MQVKALEVGYFQTNCYVVFDENTMDAAVIDPGADSNKILDYLEEHKCNVRAYLLTHAHFDHCQGLEAVMEARPAPLYMSQLDVGVDIGNWYFGIRWELEPPEDTHYVSEGDVIEAGSLRFDVFETPGHTPGGLTFRCQDALFTGDTLFRRSIGRYDLPSSSARELANSLEKLRDLPGNYEVFPGHESATELDYERRFNHYMNAPWEL